MTALHIAHNIGLGTDAALRAAFPQATVTALPPAGPWEIPDDANALVFFHPRPASASAGPRPMAAAPAGWPKSIRFVQLPAVGIDDQPDWLFDGPVVCNVRGANSQPIAEYVLAAMLSHEKRLHELWLTPGRAWPTWAESVANPLGTLQGKTLGLVGYGDIGREVARMARPFRMRIVASRRSAAAPEEGVTFLPLEQTVAQADHLVCAAPLTRESRHLLDAAVWRHARPGQHFINVGRGGLVDQDALVAALREGRPAAATLDVTDPEPLPAEHPLLAMPQVRVSPHRSATSTGVMERTFERIVANLRRFAAGEPVQDVVDRVRGY